MVTAAGMFQSTSYLSPTESSKRRVQGILQEHQEQLTQAHPLWVLSCMRSFTHPFASGSASRQGSIAGGRMRQADAELRQGLRALLAAARKPGVAC